VTSPGHPDGSLDAVLQERHGLLAGTDEVGRGALAGPLVVAAVILDPRYPIYGIDDSKRLSARRREALAGEIRRRAVAWAVVAKSPEEVDELNVLGATRSAMQEAVWKLRPEPACVVSDAVALRDLPIPVLVETKADRRYLCVGAASILAKVERDAIMVQAARDFPGYGWERNKGYPSPEHLVALTRLGPTSLHRRSFAPVRVLA
jgi:ribonuclease HII